MTPQNDWQIFLNPYDSDSAESLATIGVAQHHFADGQLTSDELNRDHIDPDVFIETVKIALYSDSVAHGQKVFENLPFGFMEFDEITATQTLAFLKQSDATLMHSLLHYGNCPDGDASITVLHNIYGETESYYSYHPEGIPLETTCSEEQMRNTGIVTSDLEGVHFDDTTVRNEYREVGKSVVPVFMRDEWNNQYAGSAVIVSSNGHLLTVAHNLVASEGEFFKDISVKYNGREYFLEEKNILYVNQASDQALIKIPELANELSLPVARLATIRPKKNDELFIVGHPLTPDEDAQEPQRAYSFGFYESTFKDNVHPDQDTLENLSAEGDFIQMTARAFPGNSGGATFNPQGELVGLTSNIVTVINRTQATSVLWEDADDQNFADLLWQILDSQNNAP